MTRFSATLTIFGLFLVAGCVEWAGYAMLGGPAIKYARVLFVSIREQTRSTGDESMMVIDCTARTILAM